MEESKEPQPGHENGPKILTQLRALFFDYKPSSEDDLKSTMEDINKRLADVQERIADMLADGTDPTSALVEELTQEQAKLEGQKLLYTDWLRPQGDGRGRAASTIDTDSRESVWQQISLYVSTMRHISLDTKNGSTFQEFDKLCRRLFDNDLLSKLVASMGNLGFEARKDLGLVFKFLFTNHRAQITAYFDQHRDIVQFLVTGYNTRVTHTCGSILRQVARQEVLCRYILESGLIFNLFEYVQVPAFEVASDAFATFNILLSYHPAMAATYLDEHFDDMVVERYLPLLLSRNYVTKRQSLKILRDLMLDRVNFKGMIKFINSPAALDVMVELMVGQSKMIKEEAFHLFKIFILNPRKTDTINNNLVQYRKGILKALEKLDATPEIDNVRNKLNGLEKVAGAETAEEEPV